MKGKWLNALDRIFTCCFRITAIICPISLFFVFFGDVFLGMMGLQWRNWIKMLLRFLWMGGGFLLLAGIPIILLLKTKGSWKVRLPAAIIAIAIIIGVAKLAIHMPFYIYIANKPETVVVWNGQKCVRSDFIWFDATRDWYAYHGWFVMGNESLHHEEFSM